MDQDIAFTPWVERMRCTPATVGQLQAMLDTDPLRGFLKPRPGDGGLAFTLQEAIIIARKPAGA